MIRAGPKLSDHETGHGISTNGTTLDFDLLGRLPLYWRAFLELGVAMKLSSRRPSYLRQVKSDGFMQRHLIIVWHTPYRIIHFVICMQCFEYHFLAHKFVLSRPAGWSWPGWIEWNPRSWRAWWQPLLVPTLQLSQFKVLDILILYHWSWVVVSFWQMYLWSASFLVSTSQECGYMIATSHDFTVPGGLTGEVWKLKLFLQFQFSEKIPLRCEAIETLFFAPWLRKALYCLRMLDIFGHTGRFLPCYSCNITVISWSRCGSDGQTRLSKGCWWLRAAPFGCVVCATAGRTRRFLCPSPCTSCTSTGCRSQPLRESNSIRRGANVEQRVGTQWKIVP